MDYKIAEDVAQMQLDLMEEEFGAIDPASAEVVFTAIRRGLIDYDESTATVTYHLQRPPETTNSTIDASQIVLQEPDSEAMERMGKASSFEADKDGKVVADGSMIIKQTIALVSYVGGWPTALAKRIKRRDMLVLGALCNFFN